MKRKIFLSIMLIASIGLLICSLKENTQPSEEEKENYFSKMQIVDKEIDKILEQTKDLNQKEKEEIIYNFLINLAENGTEDAPYSLIIKDSICKSDNMISFQYSCGVLGGVWLVDKDYLSKVN